MSEREDDPWKDIEAELLRNIGYPLVTVADLRADTFVARFFAARAAEATQHQQEIAAKDAIIKQQAADLKVGGEMQDRETALKEIRAAIFTHKYYPEELMAKITSLFVLPVEAKTDTNLLQNNVLASPLPAPPVVLVPAEEPRP